MTDGEQVIALSERVSVLEEGFSELAQLIDSLLSADAEDEFMEERQRWINECRERAAEKRRKS